MDVDRKCGTFIFPQLQELGQGQVVEGLVARGAELASQAEVGAHDRLVDGYQDLLAAAQRALREARAQEVTEGAARQVESQARSKVISRLQLAKGRLSPPRWAKLEAELAQLPDGAAGADARLAAIERTLRTREDAERVREVREAERLRAQAHLVVRPRAQDSSRSRRALREQAALLSRLATAPDPPPPHRNGLRGGGGSRSLGDSGSG